MQIISYPEEMSLHESPHRAGLEALPSLHSNPFHRMLVAQANSEGAFNPDG